MKAKIPIVVGGLLGLLFVVFGSNFFLKFIPIPQPPADSHAAAFMGAMYATGFLTFVKVLEILGGVLVAIPKTRNLGLMILTPIIVNILAFHIFITAGAGMTDPPIIFITVACIYLLVEARKSVSGICCSGAANG